MEENIRDVLEQIYKICQQIPPSYAYGDNEAASYMANMIQEIDNLVYPVIAQ